MPRICPEGFRHNEQRLRIVDYMCREGRGLNLTWEVRDAIVNHQTSTMPATLEGQIVRYSDKIAYIHHDMDDAIRAGVLRDEDIPAEISDVVGRTLSQRLDYFIHDIITYSSGKPLVSMSPETLAVMRRLRAFMSAEVYTNPVVKGEESKAEALVETLYSYYLDHIDLLPDILKKRIDLGDSRERAVCDHISSMTDRYAVALYENLFIPRNWSVL